MVLRRIRIGDIAYILKTLLKGTIVNTRRMVLHPDYNRLMNWDFCLVEVDDIPLDGTTV